MKSMDCYESCAGWCVGGGAVERVRNPKKEEVEEERRKTTQTLK